MDLEEIIKFAEKTYLPNCTFRNAKDLHGRGKVRANNKTFERFFHPSNAPEDVLVIPSNGSGCVYYNGKWAPLCNDDYVITMEVYPPGDIYHELQSLRHIWEEENG